MQSNFGHLHLHTQFSALDGMSDVDSIVERIARYKQPMFATTDHKNMSATVKAYKAAKANDLVYFPGIEQYIIDPKIDMAGLNESADAQRYHLGMLALDLKGYQGLVKMSTLSFQRPRFHKFPRLLVDDLVEFGEEYGKHIAVTTGCVFGLLEKTLIDYGTDAASGILNMLCQVTPNVYVEVQKHNIPDGENEYPEDKLISETIALADKHGLPVLTTNDSHYLDQKQKSAHNMMKMIGYMSDDGSSEFPGDTYHVASTGWMKEKWDSDTWDRFEEAYGDILSKNKLSIPELDTFKAHVPEMSKTPDTELRNLCENALWEYIDNDDDLVQETYMPLLNHELDVIRITETPNYFLLVKQCVDYAKKQNIPIEARGSAAGSLVCFLLGITQVDPIVWGTTFERFLSEDRVGQMPDVDIDISDVDRGIILEYLNNLEINGVRYKTSQIGTFSRLGQAKDDPNDTGSVFNSYMSFLRNSFKDKAWIHEKNIAEAEGRKPVKGHADERGAINFNSSPEQSIKTMADVKRIRPDDYQGLKEIIDMNSVYRSYGTHAGGILISGVDVNIDDFIPQMFIPSGNGGDGTWVTQYTMKDVEQFGLLKMDWLGQTSLTVMRKCQEFIGRDNPLDFSWIPFDDPAVMKFVTPRKNHPGLFHLEQYPKSVAMSELKPKTTEDFVIWQAYSMPGAADSGAKDIYLQRRNSKAQANYGYKHQILKDTFDLTNGVMLFQEQVLEVCRGVGMPPKELTNFFKIIKDSGSGATERNKIRLEQARPRFEQLSKDAGLSDGEISWVWKQMVAMGGYAFNRAHAASYGIRSYRTAYLKKYYPVEYMGALLYCWAGSNAKAKGKGGKEMRKELIYRAEAENMKLNILPAKIDKSKGNWTVETIGSRKVLREGFVSLKGIGEAAAEKIEQGLPYSDMLDFAERSGVTGSKPLLKYYNKNGELPPPDTYIGNLKVLYEAGVLDSLI